MKIKLRVGRAQQHTILPNRKPIMCPRDVRCPMGSQSYTLVDLCLDLVWCVSKTVFTWLPNILFSTPPSPPLLLHTRQQFIRKVALAAEKSVTRAGKSAWRSDVDCSEGKIMLLVMRKNNACCFQCPASVYIYKLFQSIAFFLRFSVHQPQAFIKQIGSTM